MPFLNNLDVRIISQGRYRLNAPFDYQVPNEGMVTVPAGFVTDFASIPRGFRWLITGHGDTRKPAVIHDYLCSGRIPRKEADRIFLLAMKDNGVSKWKRTLCWSAVRLAAIVTGKG